MLMRGRFFLNRRLGLEQAKYGTYLCQCFILDLEINYILNQYCLKSLNVLCRKGLYLYIKQIGL